MFDFVWYTVPVLKTTFCDVPQCLFWYSHLVIFNLPLHLNKKSTQRKRKRSQSVFAFYYYYYYYFFFIIIIIFSTGNYSTCPFF